MTKPWQTARWKKKRAEYLTGKKCEWCGTNEPPLTINHRTNYYPKYERAKIANRMMKEFFSDKQHESEKSEIRKRALETTAITWIDCCPRCGSLSITGKNGNYFCRNCKAKFDKPGRKPDFASFRLFQKNFLKEFSLIHKEEIDAEFIPQETKANEDYYNFVDVMVLCKRCNMAFTKGYHLCPVCKAKYVGRGRIQCYDCFLKTERGKRYLAYKQELAELEEEDMD